MGPGAKWPKYFFRRRSEAGALPRGGADGGGEFSCPLHWRERRENCREGGEGRGGGDGGEVRGRRRGDGVGCPFMGCPFWLRMLHRCRFWSHQVTRMCFWFQEGHVKNLWDMEQEYSARHRSIAPCLDCYWVGDFNFWLKASWVFQTPKK